ncbi:hypothetical protein BROC_00813 [Candidatus Brocadiaceae bacterium]|nr:hypothetical protein BROC_00813 [Candidatus Brocadiaceae bacterium]
MSNYQELINLILRPYESKEHDFKGPMAWNGNAKKACCEIVKDILAIANTKGGFIVIGMDEELITARFRVTGTDNRLLVSYDTSRELSMAYIAMIPEIVEERTYSLNEWKAGIVDLSVDVIKSICLKFNWDNPSVSVFKKDVEKLFSRKL